MKRIRRNFDNWKKKNYNYIENRELAHIFPVSFLLFLNKISNVEFTRIFRKEMLKIRFEKIYKSKSNYIVMYEHNYHNFLDNSLDMSLVDSILLNNNVCVLQSLAVKLLKKSLYKHHYLKYHTFDKETVNLIVNALKCLELHHQINCEIQNKYLTITTCLKYWWLIRKYQKDA